MSSTSSAIFFAPLKVPITDPQTGLMSRPWYLFFQALFNRVGGSTGPANDDLEQIAIEDFDISGADQIATALALADAQAGALDFGLTDPPSTDASDALMLLMDAQDNVGIAGAPSAKVGLTAVNGSALTFMRSDAAPPIDQALAPTWTGQHIFTKTFSFGGSAPVEPISFESTAPGFSMVNTGAGADGKAWEFGVTTNTYTMNLANDAGSVARNIFVVTRTGNAVTGMTYGNATDKPPHTFNGAVGVNGNSPPAQVTGWGVPTGPAVVANFPGATATLVQCSNAIAQIIKDLKALGPYGA